MSTLPIGLRMLYNLFIAGLVVTLLTMSTLPIGLRMQPVDSGPCCNIITQVDSLHGELVEADKIMIAHGLTSSSSYKFANR